MRLTSRYYVNLFFLQFQLTLSGFERLNRIKNIPSFSVDPNETFLRYVVKISEKGVQA